MLPPPYFSWLELYLICNFRQIYEGIAVTLQFKDQLIAVLLMQAYRMLFVPAQQQLNVNPLVLPLYFTWIPHHEIQHRSRCLTLAALRLKADRPAAFPAGIPDSLTVRFRVVVSKIIVWNVASIAVAFLLTDE